MKRLIIILLGMLAMVQVNAEMADSYEQNISFRKIKIKSDGNKEIQRAPYHGDLITSSYDVGIMQLELWFHYEVENAEVIITKDGETVAEETFYMLADEALECDFSGCDSGTYTVCVVADGEMYVIGTFNVS